MRLRIHWTPTSVLHIERHGISPKDVHAVITGWYVVTRTGTRRRLIGSTADRILTVIVEPSRLEAGSYEVVTARPSSRREKRLFRKERR